MLTLTNEILASWSVDVRYLTCCTVAHIDTTVLFLSETSRS